MVQGLVLLKDSSSKLLLTSFYGVCVIWTHPFMELV